VPDLPPNRDAIGVRDVLASPEVCAYPPERVRVLVDEEATRERILAELDWLAQQARGADARTFFYFSGHGGRKEGASYLAAFDTRSEELSTTAISAGELSEALARCEGEVTVVLDCCFAGGMAEAATASPSSWETFDDSLRASIQRRNRVVFAASRPALGAYPDKDEPYGLLTGHLIEGLRGKASTDGAGVNVQQLFNYLQRNVKWFSQDKQHPAFIAHTESFYTLTRYPRRLPPSAVFEKDVYIAYDHRDAITADWVESTFVPQLEREGISVWDASAQGANIVDFEQEATNKSSYILAVITDAALQDTRSHIPRTMGILQAVHTRTPRLIPILREDIPNLYSKAVGMFCPVELHDGNLMSHKRQMDLLLKRLKKPPHLK
jgi:Caspase domain/TIR domain